MSAEMEWRDIHDAPNYEVSDAGMVRNKTTHFILKHSNKGQVRIGYQGKARTRSVKAIQTVAFWEGSDEL